MNILGNVLGSAGLSAVDRLSAALFHFLWQGAIVALLYAAADRSLRRRGAASQARYALACCALAVMLLAPVVTFARSAATGRAGAGIPAAHNDGAAAPSVRTTSVSANAGRPSAAAAAPGPWRGRLLGIWLAGVAALSLRFLAGCAGIARLARQVSDETDSAITEAFDRLRGRLGVSPGVRLVRSFAVQVPSAIGVLKPIVLLPVSALTGLDARQVEALLAHELAHVKRHDYLVNLFQSLAETLLFYHPAVWWVSGRIRAERENACDDLAVAVTGDRRVYAAALVGLEELRAGSRKLALAANGGQLRGRVLRLFPGYAPSLAGAADARSRRAAGTLAICALVVLGAAAWIGPDAGATSDLGFPITSAPAAPAVPESPNAPNVPARPAKPALPAAAPAALPPAAVSAPVALPVATPAPAPAAVTLASAAAPAPAAAPPAPVAAPAAPASPAPPAAAPAEPLSDDDMAALRTQGVTPRFVHGISALGYSRVSVSDLVALRVHGVTPEEIGEYQKIFGKISLDRCVALKIHGASTQWIREIAASFGGKISPDQATALRIHGVDQDLLARFRQAGYPDLSVDEALAVRIHGVDPSQAAALSGGISRPSIDALLSARIHGVTADFAREIRSEIPEASLEELVSFRIHGVTGSFISEMKKLGFKNLSPDEAVSLRIHGVTPEYVRDMKAAGVKELDAEGATALRIHGVTTDFARALKGEGYSSLSTDDLTSLRIHGQTLEKIRKINRAAGRRVPLDEIADDDMDRE